MFSYLPNLFTAVRLALVPWIGVLVLHRRFHAALLATLIAGLSDAADGFLARRFGWTSRVGAWLDPLADKALLVTLFVVLGCVGAMPWWLVALVFARDAVILAMVGAAFAFTSIRDFPPSIWGKLSTIVQVVACLGGLWWQSGPAMSFLAGVTALATAWSGIDYVRLGLLRWRRKRERREACGAGL